MVAAATVASIATHTTFESIGVWLILSGDDDALTSCTLQYKKAGDSTWQDALPLHYPIRGIRATATAASGATTVAIGGKVPVTIPNGTTLTFGNGQAATLAAQASVGVTTITVQALSGPIPSGSFAWVDTSPAIRALYGSIPLRDAGSEYLLKLVVTNANGVTCPSTVSTSTNDVSATASDRTASTATSATIETAAGQVVTRSENIATPAALLSAVTHYVDASTGSDAADGSVGTPWKTIRKALASAPSGAIVRVAPGHYTVSGQARSLPLTLVAQYPSVDDNGAVINAGNHAIIEYGVSVVAGDNTAAVSSTGGGSWSSVSLIGPNDGVSRQAWKWTGAPVAAATALGYAATRDGIPNRVTHCVATLNSAGGSASTPQRWREMMARNVYHHSSFYWTTGAQSDLHLILPDGSDPNSSYVTMGKGVGIDITGPDVRVCGMVFRCFAAGVRISSGARRAVVDHNWTQLCKYGVQINGTASSTYSRDAVIERNRVADTNLWSASQQADVTGPKDTSCISWMFIKGSSLNDGEAGSSWSRAGAESESAGVYMPGGGIRTVIRNNVMDGPFNGVTAFGSGYDRYATAETDVYGNTITHIADDCFEPETVAINWRIWGNDCSWATVGMSTGPVAYGPVYLMRNRFWRIGTDGVGRNDDGNPRGSGLWIKHSFNSHPQSKLYIVNNTLWTDRDYSRPSDDDVAKIPTWGVDATNPAAGGSVDSELFYLRNNVIRVTRKIADNRAAYWDEDYNQLSIDPRQGTAHNIRIGSGSSFDRDTMAGYRTLTDDGDHSNPNGADLQDYAATDALLADPVAGNLALKTGTNALLAAGVVVPTIADSQVVGIPDRLYQFTGAAPSLGYRERDYVAADPVTGDTTPPVISAISSVPLANGATVVWTTDEGADTQIEYGTTTAYGTTTTLKDAAPYTLAHVDVIPSLQASTTYHYRVRSRDAGGNLAVSSDQTFTTLAPTAPGPVASRSSVARTPVTRTPVVRVAV